MADAPDLADSVRVLYAVQPADFVRTRTSLVADAKAAGDKELAKAIAALRKPSAAAHLINRLTRDNDELLGELRDLGERLRDAQGRLDGGLLKDLAGERSSVLHQLVQACAPGESATTREQVAATLTAALADPQAQDAVESGALVSAISYSGFGEVDLSEAIATPLRLLQGGAGTDRPTRSGKVSDRGNEERAAAQQEAARRMSAARAARARAALERAEEAVELSQDSVTSADEGVKSAKRALREAHVTRTDAIAARDTALEALAAAEQDLRD